MIARKRIEIEDIVNGYVITKIQFPEYEKEFCETADEVAEVVKNYLKGKGFNKDGTWSW